MAERIDGLEWLRRLDERRAREAEEREWKTMERLGLVGNVSVKHSEIRDEAYLKVLRTMPCAVCGFQPVGNVHHLKTGRGGWGQAGDDRAVPLCQFGFGSQADCHGIIEGIGTQNEVRWFAENGVDCEGLVARLYAAWHADGTRAAVLEALLQIDIEETARVAEILEGGEP